MATRTSLTSERFATDYFGINGRFCPEYARNDYTQFGCRRPVYTLLCLTGYDVTDKPGLQCCKTIIGFGAPNKANRHDCHGSVPGADEVALVLERPEWPYAPFEIPVTIHDAWDATAKGASDQAQWEARFSACRKEWPEPADDLMRRMSGE